MTRARDLFLGLGLASAVAVVFVAACFPSLDGLAGGAPADGTTDASSGEGGTNEAGMIDGDAPCGADLTRDPKNCGVCGRSCLGGTCAAGQCAPFVLLADRATNESSRGSALVIDDTAAWIVVGRDVVRVPIAEGGVGTSIPSLQARNIDADDAFLYATTWDGKVVRLPKSGGPATVLTTTDLTGHIAVGGGLVAFGDENHARALTLPGGADAGLGIDRPTGPLLGSLAVSGGRVFVYASDSLGAVRELGVGAVSDPARNADPEARMRGAAGGVVWAFRDNSLEVLGTSVGGGRISVLDDAGAPIGGVAIDATWVYAAVGRDTGNEGKILRAPRDGSRRVEIVATGQPPVHEIAVSSRFVAWITNGSDASKRSLVVLVK